MATEPLSSSWQTPLDDESARRRQLNEAYPLGVAPYSERVLRRFGFWGGFIGAGIAGAVNLRRTKQSRAIPALLLLTLAIMVIYWVVLAILADQNVFTDSTTSSAPFLGFVNVAIGVGFARWIAGRQQNFSYRWQQLVGAPNWSDQGGWLRAIGWYIVSVVIAIALYLALYPILLAGVIQVAHPSQQFAVDGVSVTMPAGWAQLDPDEVDANCDTTGLTCVAVVADRMTGSHATLWIVSSAEPQAVINTVDSSSQDQMQPITLENPHRYTPAILQERSASTVSYRINGNTLVFTAIADGGNSILLRLLCAGTIASTCETLRDNFVSTLGYAYTASESDASSVD